MNLNVETDVSVFIVIKDWAINTLLQPVPIGIILLGVVLFFILKRHIFQKYNAMLDWINRKIKKRFIQQFLLIIIKGLSSPLFTAIITCICPYLIDQYNSKINVIVGIWIICIFLNVLSTNYIKRKNKMDKILLSTLNHIQNIQNKTADKIYATRENIPTIIDTIIKNNGIGKTINNHYFKFDDAAKIACNAIYKIIQEATGSKQHQVTIYKRYQSPKGTECPTTCPLKNNCPEFGQRKEWTKMIACSNYQDKDSLSINQEHCFNYFYASRDKTNQTIQKQHFYIHFFSENKTDIEILTGSENINNSFLFHNSTKTREEQIKQYIGIPISHIETSDSLSANLNSPIRNQQHITFAVIQIDFQEEWLLGKTKNEVTSITNSAFSGIISYLQTALQVEELTKNLLSNISDISNLNKQTTSDLKREYGNLVKSYNDIVLENNLLKEENDFFKADIELQKAKNEKKPLFLNKKLKINR